MALIYHGKNLFLCNVLFVVFNTCAKNFIDFLKEYRLKKARDLLKNTNIRINEIAKMVGYDSASYFTTIFHKYYNTTPAQYREKGDN